MHSKDMPASFRPYTSAAQFAAADAPPPLYAPSDAIPRAASSPRLGSSPSTLLETTAAHQQRAHRPVHISLEETKGIVDEARRRRVVRQVGDPFVKAFSSAEPTRLLASRRDDVRVQMAKERALERLISGHRPSARPASSGHVLAERLVSFYSADGTGLPAVPSFRRLAAAADEAPSAELQKGAAMVKLFREHDLNMRTLEGKKPQRMYIPPHKPALLLDRLQIERDSSRLMRKLVLRPRSHTFE
jgi:hypothetical protein